MNPLAVIGRVVISALSETGHLSIFSWKSLSHVVRPPFYWRLIAQQMLRIGYFSLPVVALTAFFTGGVLALQIYYGSDQFNSESIVATIVALGITRELGPVLGGLMVAGRASAAIAAELGTMRVTEQIDALSTLATNPFKYLVVPRIVAAMLTLPLLVFVGDVLGIFGGFVVGTQSLDFNAGVYIKTTSDFLELDDITSGMIKSAVFGLIIAMLGCYHGFNSKGGAQGVGRATTNAVVTSSILILASNYVMTSLFFSS
ncbi:MAG: ABC transporter permease [Rhodobiaceae bacterium]|nr:ABC transporter permease [Rhodobiaceae bacterium]